MKCAYEKVSIREATVEDALLLCRWWNDGEIMEHAGFPKGLGTTIEEISEKLRHRMINVVGISFFTQMSR